MTILLFQNHTKTKIYLFTKTVQTKVFLWLKRVNLWANYRYKHTLTKEMAQEYRKQTEKYFGSIEKAWNEKYTITKTRSSSGGLVIKLK